MTATPSPATGLGARLARNSLHSASGRVIAMIAWLALTPPLVRALGPEGFGIWSLFYALTGWLGTMDLGFSQVALRFGAAARARAAGEEPGDYATLASAGYVVLGIAWLAVVLVARDPVLDLLRITGPARPLAAQAFLVGAGVFVISGLANTTAAALQAWDRFDLANIVSLTTSLAQVAGLTLALLLNGGLLGCLAAVTAAWGIAWLVGLALLARGVPRFRWGSLTSARGRLRDTLRFGIPVQGANTLSIVHQTLGKLLLVRIVSLAAVVPYELGLRVSTACFTFSQLVLVAMLPEVSALHARDESARLQALHRRAGRVVTCAAAVLTAGLVGAGVPLFAAWLGHADADATLALRGLALAGYTAVVGGLAGAFGRGIAQIRMEIEWAGLALVTHLVLGLLLVPRIGLAGALVAVVVANTISAFWFSFRLGQALRWPPGWWLWEPFVLPVIAIALGGLVGAWLAGLIASPWWSLVASGTLAGGIAFALLLAFRHVEWRELVSLARRGVAA